MTDAQPILVLASGRALTAWIDEELSGLGFTILLARSVSEAVAALVDDPPRPQILVADFDAMSTADITELHLIRDAGWFGLLIGIGKVADDVRSELSVGRVLPRPLGSEVLRKVVNQLGLDRPTTKLHPPA